MAIKQPTLDEYKDYKGAHCHRLWSKLSDAWHCPSCSRTKYEIMRWTTRYINHNDGSRSSYKGWMAGLHTHHDHSQGYLSVNNGRFPETVICAQCNSADGAVKKKLSLPKDFSFSPEEIGCFVEATLHGSHKIDYEIAKVIYDAITRHEFHIVKSFIKLHEQIPKI